MGSGDRPADEILKKLEDHVSDLEQSCHDQRALIRCLFRHQEDNDKTIEALKEEIQQLKSASGEASEPQDIHGLKPKTPAVASGSGSQETGGRGVEPRVVRKPKRKASAVASGSGSQETGGRGVEPRVVRKPKRKASAVASGSGSQSQKKGRPVERQWITESEISDLDLSDLGDVSSDFP